MTRSILLTSLIAMLSWPMHAAGQSDTARSLITPYPGSRPGRTDERGFAEFKFVVGTNANGETPDERLPNIAVAGELVQYSYENPRDRSILEIITNYKEGLEAAGFDILFECADAECGPLRRSVRALNGTRFASTEMQFLTARLDDGEAQTFVQINLIGPRHEIHILDREEMERGLVVVTPAAIREGLLVDGRVVLDGILFDLDRATLRPESSQALDAIAEFLRENPTLRAYIVGHTDSSGDFDYNMNLSSERADAVIAALVDDYGIDRDRLAGYGVGPLAPMRTNSSEDTRSRNRRVEMVEM